jgi:hypothetical protein
MTLPTSGSDRNVSFLDLNLPMTWVVMKSEGSAPMVKMVSENQAWDPGYMMYSNDSLSFRMIMFTMRHCMSLPLGVTS